MQEGPIRARLEVQVPPPTMREWVLPCPHCHVSVGESFNLSVPQFHHLDDDTPSHGKVIKMR